MQNMSQYESETENPDLSGFVMSYGALIKKIANHLKCRLPTSTDLNDLLQAGLVGLLEARSQFSETNGASFETYASIKIRGAMIDELRRNTGITRDMSQNMKLISKAKATVHNALQSGYASSKKVAEQMGITENRYARISAEIDAYQMVSMSDSEVIEQIACPQTLNPLSVVEKDDTISSIKEVLTRLPKREQQILALYYNEHLNFKEIAEIMELTEARISQVHSLALEKIRHKYQYSFGEVE